jgi:hypothetical protein
MSASGCALVEPRERSTAQPGCCPRGEGRSHVGIRTIIGEPAWARLPPAVRARFDADVQRAEYTGCFEVVRASRAGRLLALVCRLLGTPVAPYTGTNVPATVRVFPAATGGMVWERTYRFPGGRTCVVSSVKQSDERGGLVEVLPFGLRMPLEVFERQGVLNFVSRGYFFNCFGLHIAVPDFLPPGVTHVAHLDEGGGWFRFTMIITHKSLGEVFFQTGRFRSAREAL